MKIRRAIMFLSFFLLPITLNYFSPVLIVQAGFEKTLTIMHIIYAAMAVSAVFCGAAWCGWVCPFGALQECLPGKSKRKKRSEVKFPNLKYITGTLFLLLILLPVILLGVSKFTLFYHMEDTKVTVDSVHGLILYYIISGSIIAVCALLGKRVWCRYLCPMFIFNYIGIGFSKLFKIPRMKMTCDSQKCSQCGACSASCQMGLDVATMVKTGCINNTDCIQCGECIHACSKHVIKRTWR